MKSVVSSDFFTANRECIMQKLEGGVLVMSAYSEVQRNYDAAFRFEQESNFWYATGIDRAGWWVIIDGSRGKSWLVAPDVDATHELFDGSLSPESAAQRSGITMVVTRTAAADILKQIARQHRLVYTVDQPERAESFGFVLNPALREMRDLLARQFSDVRDFRPKLARLRAIKQPAEIAAIEAAIDITARTLDKVKERFSSYRHEYEIEADITHGFRFSGADGHAYDPIIASAGNACTLHYGENNAKLAKRSLVLIDVGAQFQRYAADITRTYAYGEPTRRQRDVHAAVESAHQNIVALLRPGLGVDEYSEQVDLRMKRALVDVGLLSSVDDEKYRHYFPHSISHGLGLDVHDSLGAPRVFEPGMVLTVEPGIYIPDEQVGVRIEDDVLITASGSRNLSAKLSTGL